MTPAISRPNGARTSTDPQTAERAFRRGFKQNPDASADLSPTPQPALTLDLPEPPTLNRMIWLAQRKSRKGPGGRWMRQAQSLYWIQQQEYEAHVRLLVAPAVRSLAVLAPWPVWGITAAHYRLHQLRDHVELMAGLKWAVDALVQAGLVCGDAPRQLVAVATPTQSVARADRGVTLTVTPVTPVAP